MKNDILKYSDGNYTIQMSDGTIKPLGHNIIGMINFVFKENKIELYDGWEMIHGDFLKEYNDKILMVMKEGMAWKIVKVYDNMEETETGHFFIDESIADFYCEMEAKKNPNIDFKYIVKQIKI